MQASASNTLPPWLVPIFVLALISLVCTLTSWISGWHSLTRRFRANSEPYGDILTAGPFFYKVYFRLWCRYGSVIRMRAADDALYLSVLFPFRIGHPPLRIPWEEIQFGRTTVFFFPYVILTLGREEQIPMRISERMARNLGIFERIEKQILMLG
jgi:hypothetical protein